MAVNTLSSDAEFEKLLAHAVEVLRKGNAQLGASAPAVLRDHPEFSAIDPNVRFQAIEALLRRALEKTEAVDEAGKAFQRLVPQQRDCDLLLIELVTLLFENNRGLHYQVRVLSEVVRELGARQSEQATSLSQTLRDAAEALRS